jgi:hypothetical protein
VEAYGFFRPIDAALSDVLPPAKFGSLSLDHFPVRILLPQPATFVSEISAAGTTKMPVNCGVFDGPQVSVLPRFAPKFPNAPGSLPVTAGEFPFRGVGKGRLARTICVVDLAAPALFHSQTRRRRTGDWFDLECVGSNPQSSASQSVLSPRWSDSPRKAGEYATSCG